MRQEQSVAAEYRSKYVDATRTCESFQKEVEFLRSRLASFELSEHDGGEAGDKQLSASVELEAASKERSERVRARPVHSSASSPTHALEAWGDEETRGAGHGINRKATRLH